MATNGPPSRALPPYMYGVEIRFDAGDGTPVVTWSHHERTDTSTARPESETCHIYRYICRWLNQEVTDNDGLAYMCQKAHDCDKFVRNETVVSGRVAKIGVTLFDRLNTPFPLVIVLENDGQQKWSSGRDTDFDRPCLRLPEETCRRLRKYEDDSEEDSQENFFLLRIPATDSP